LFISAETDLRLYSLQTAVWYAMGDASNLPFSSKEEGSTPKKNVEKKRNITLISKGHSLTYHA